MDCSHHTRFFSYCKARDENQRGEAKKKQKQEQTGQVNFVWALAGGYLIYLGGKLLYSLYRDGADSTPILVVIPAAAVFIGVGFWLLRREWKAYQFGAAHKDDPSTWNDDPVEEELPADSGDEEDPL